MKSDDQEEYCSSCFREKIIGERFLQMKQEGSLRADDLYLYEVIRLVNVTHMKRQRIFLQFRWYRDMIDRPKIQRCILGLFL